MRSALKSAAFGIQISVLLALPAASLLADDSATAMTPSAAAQAASPTASSPAAAPDAVSDTLAATADLTPSSEALSSTAAAPAALPADVSASAAVAPVEDSGTAGDSSAAEPSAPLPDIQDNNAASQAAEIQASTVQSDDDESPFKWSNFLLGFLGGAVLGSTYGLLDAPPNNARVRNEDIGIYGGGAALVFGTVAIFLGGTTPQAAKPPQAGIRRPLPELAMSLRF